MFDYLDSSDIVTNSNIKYFLKLKNQQYFNQTGHTLFAKLYKIIDKDCHDICFNVFDKLLEELSLLKFHFQYRTLRSFLPIVYQRH